MNGIAGKIGLLITLLSFAGCAISTADHKNLALLQPGVPRNAILGEFGEPLLTVAADNVTTDVYGFYQGYKGASRYLGAGLPDVHVSVPREPDIEVRPEPFRENEPDDEREREAWA